MERPHRSPDLRERVLAAVDAGRPVAEIVEWFGVGARSVRRWAQWRRERGGVATALIEGPAGENGREADKEKA